MTFRKKVSKILTLLSLPVGVIFYFGLNKTTSTRETAESRILSGPNSEAKLSYAFKNKLSDVDITDHGTVIKLLPDDTKGSKHQRFIVRVDHGQTVLIAHNIDLAPRLNDLRVGDLVTFQGVYEYNEKGGVVHWTHRDPGKNRKGGWIEHDGILFK